jgi:hypothetical protein
LFGKKQGIEDHLTYSIQFLQLADEQITGPMPVTDIPQRLLAYVTEFDSGLNHNEFNSPKFAYRLLFHKKLVNRPGQADRVIEFIDPDSDAAKAIDKEYWVKKEVERPKFRATDVVQEVQNAGFKKFRIQPDHVEMWKADEAKEPGKGFGVEVAGAWYWYQSWINRCIELCKAAGDKFKLPAA